MSAELWGNVIGRLLMSWFILFFVLLLVRRGRWRQALRSSVWPWGGLVILALFGLGLLGTAVSAMGGG
jgi:hypothetical protein